MMVKNEYAAHIGIFAIARVSRDDFGPVDFYRTENLGPCCRRACGSTWGTATGTTAAVGDYFTDEVKTVVVEEDKKKTYEKQEH